MPFLPQCAGTFGRPMPLRASLAMCGSAPIKSTCSQRRPVASRSSGPRCRISVCTNSRCETTEGSYVLVSKQSALRAGSGGGVFLCVFWPFLITALYFSPLLLCFLLSTLLPPHLP